MARKNKFKSNGGKGNERNDSTKGKGANASKSHSGDSSRESSGSGSERSGETDDTSRDQARDEVKNKSKSNDPAWYGKNPDLVRDAASIPFSIPLGAKVSPFAHFNTTGTLTVEADVSAGQTVEGIFSLVLKPSVGYASNRYDPVNVAASQFYTEVRYINSGRKNYDPADLMIYALAVADLYSFIIWCQRLYGMAFQYSQRNWYIGKATIAANDVDPDDLIRNLANFRYWLNNFIAKVSSYAIPANISLFAKKVFQYSALYSESVTADIKDQLYQFVPEGFYKFQLDSSGKGMLHFLPLYMTLGRHTAAGIMQYGESLISNLWGDEDFGLMSGDIIKAYGSNLIGLTNMDSVVDVPIVHDEWVLNQFKNAWVVDVDRYKYSSTVLSVVSPSMTYTLGTVTADDGDIYQGPDGNIVCHERANLPLTHNAVGQVTRGMLIADRLLNVLEPDPSPELVMEMTRLTVSGIGDDTDTAQLICGTEIACRLVVTRMGDYGSSGYIETVLNGSAANIVGNDLTTQSRDYRQAIFAIIHGKWTPQMYFGVWSDDGTYTTLKRMDCLSDLDNVAYATPEMVKRLHQTALLSLFYVPGVAKLMEMQ